MTRHLFLMMVLVPCLFFSCKSSFTKTEDGIVVNLKNPQPGNAKSIRLQVINDDVIRVTATPSNKFSEKKSLITVFPSTQKEGWSVDEKEGNVFLKTATTIANVSLSTGEVIFTDLKGNVLLAENKGGGKSFKDIEVESKKAYTMSQVFESPDDESFYGLGQHQADEFNYKGKNEVLYQYNTKVSVPFIISSKNYGILWDNYSLTKYGDSRDYANLDSFKLYNKDGKEGGLTATYLVNGDAKQVFVERDETKIDYENLETVNNFPENFPFNNSKIIWEGQVEAKESGVHRFILYYAGYTKVYINDEEVVPERWRTAWNPNSYKFIYNFEAGKKYKIRLDWQPDGGISYVSLKFLSPRADQ